MGIGGLLSFLGNDVLIDDNLEYYAHQRAVVDGQIWFYKALAVCKDDKYDSNYCPKTKFMMAYF